MLTYSTNFANIYQNGFVFCVGRIKRLTSKTGSRWHHAKRGSVFFYQKKDDVKKVWYRWRLVKRNSRRRKARKWPPSGAAKARSGTGKTGREARKEGRGNSGMGKPRLIAAEHG